LAVDAYEARVVEERTRRNWSSRVDKAGESRMARVSIEKGSTRPSEGDVGSSLS